MGDKDKPIVFFGSNYIGNEVCFDKNFEYTGVSPRLGTDAIVSKYAKLNVKALFNTNSKNEFTPQARFTASSADQNLGHIGKTTFKSNLEDRIVLKFDKNIEKQDITNSARFNLKGQNGSWQGYSAVKFDYSQKAPKLTFNGLTLGVQKSINKKWSAYAEGYAPKECIHGQFKNTSYALGVAMKF